MKKGKYYMPSGNPHDPSWSNCLCWTESLALETPDTDILVYGVRFPVFHLKYPHRTFFFAIPAPITEDPIDVHLHLYSGRRDGKHIGISPRTYGMMVYKNPPLEEQRGRPAGKYPKEGITELQSGIIGILPSRGLINQVPVLAELADHICKLIELHRFDDVTVDAEIIALHNVPFFA